MPHLAIDSAMACRVFRGIKLGYIKDADEDTALKISLPNHRATVAPADKSQYTMHNLESSSHSFIINVTKTAHSREPLAHPDPQESHDSHS